MDQDITKIVSKYKSDKSEHGYWQYYQKHLPNTATKILEVGVKEGESIKIWNELYPEAKIFGLDLFQEFEEPFIVDWVRWFKGNQADSNLLDIVRQSGPFDFIIDDGSHNHRDQLMTFYGLIGSTKLYIIEDMFADEFWSQELPFELSMLGQMKRQKFPLNFDLYLDKIAFIYAG